MDTPQNAPTSNKLINYRPIAEIAVGLMLGIAVCGIMPAGGAAVLCIMTACGAAGVVFALLRHTRSALFAASVLVGILFAALRLPTELPNGSYTVSGIVLSAEYSDGETELILTKSELHSSASAGIFHREGRVKIITEGYLNIDVGDGVYIPKVYLRGAAKADSSKRSRFLKQLSEGITASGRLYGGGLNDDGSTSVDEISVVSKHNLPVREALTLVRSSIVRHIGRIFGTDAGIVSALIVGDKTALQSDRTEAYRATGTAHLLAISGFHTGIIAAILGLFVPKRKRWLRTAFVGIGLIMYCCIAVYAAGIVRASIMVICAMLCRALNRRADSLNGLAAAAVLILAFEPFQLYSVGFQLSFAACFGLILFSKQFETALASAHIPLAGSVSACLGASIATAPFQAAYFGCLPLYFVAGNLVAVPLFSLVMVLCIAILIIGIPFPGFAAVLAVAPRAVLFVVERCLGFLSALPYASLDLPTIPLASCALFLAMLFVLSPYVLRPFQKRAGLAVFCLLLFTGSLVFSIITL